MKTLWGLALTCLLLGSPAVAEPEPGQEEVDAIVTDRPDQSTSPYTVGSGRFQIESGPFYFQNKDGTDGGGINTLLRVGTGPNTELRLDGNFPQMGPSNFGGGSTGLGDLGLAFKANLAKEDWGGFGILTRVQFPSGTNGQNGNAVVPQVGLLTDFVLSDELALDITLAGQVPKDSAGGGRYFQGFFATSLGYAITDELGIFGEVFGQGPQDIGGPTELAVDGGFTYLLDEDTQIDIAAQKGLSGSGLDWGITIGVSARY